MFECVPCCEKLRTLEVNNDWIDNFNDMCFIENKHFSPLQRTWRRTQCQHVFGVLYGDICPYSAVGVGSS